MTDEQIIRGVEVCINTTVTNCSDCPYRKDKNCTNNLTKDFIDLINRKNAKIRSIDEHDNYVSGKVAALSVYIDKKEQEIERLKKLLDEEEKKYSLCAKPFFKEGVKELAERLKKRGFADEYYEHEAIVYVADIDNLVKEMVERKNEQ